jgi:hypothetical protein
MLVELERYHNQLDEEGEDRPVPEMIAVNPAFTSAVIPSQEHEDATIVRGPDGRGFLIRGNYRDVYAKLNPQGEAGQIGQSNH